MGSATTIIERIREVSRRRNECQTDGGTATETASASHGDTGDDRTKTSTREASDATEAEAEEGTEADAEEGIEAADDRSFGIGTVFEILQNHRRRDVVRHLTDADGELTIGGLAERIAARECDKEIRQITSRERKRVYVALYQCHLPKMADVDAITYDQRNGTVGRGPQFDRFREVLPDGDETDDDSGAATRVWPWPITKLLR